jgi:hypothetical protein
VDKGRATQLVAIALIAAATGPAHSAAETGTTAAETGAMRSLLDAAAIIFRGDPLAGRVLEELQNLHIAPAEAEAWRAWLRSRLRGLSQAALGELVAHAQAVLALTDPQGTAHGRYGDGAAADLEAGADAVAQVERVTVNPGGSRHLSAQVVERGTAPARQDHDMTPQPCVGAGMRREDNGPAGPQRPAAEHPDSAAARAHLALAQPSPGQRAAIIDLQHRLLADSERLRGAEHPDTLTARAGLAELYKWAGRSRDAIEVLERVVADHERVLGNEHVDTRAARAKLIDWRDGRGE